MSTRRQFVTTTSAAALSAATHAFAAPQDGEIKIALIGCGGRGTGACSQALTAGSTIKLVALVDPLEGKAQAALNVLQGEARRPGLGAAGSGLHRLSRTTRRRWSSRTWC